MSYVARGMWVEYVWYGIVYKRETTTTVYLYRIPKHSFGKRAINLDLYKYYYKTMAFLFILL